MVEGNGKVRVALIGPYPPPYGGVSIHIQRLEALLSSNNIECTIYDSTSFLKDTGPKDTWRPLSSPKIRKWPWIFKSPEDIAHIHSSGAKLKKIIPLIILLKILGKRIVITYESLRDDVEHFKWLKRKTAIISLRFPSHYIAVNSQIKQRLLFLGVNPKQITVIPAFLPPVIRQQDVDSIPKGVQDFINEHTPVVSANASKIVFYNGQDLYGIDMCIALCANLKVSYPKIGLVLYLPEIGDYDYFSKMKHLIVERGVEENIFLETSPHQFYPIIMKSDVFVRPTNTDGDSVSLREARYFKVPSIASDAVPRPEGTVIFRSRDIDDFTLKVKDVLDNYEWHKKKLEAIMPDDNFEKITRIYQILETE